MPNIQSSNPSGMNDDSARGGIRTHTAQILNLLSLPFGLREQKRLKSFDWQLCPMSNIRMSQRPTSGSIGNRQSKIDLAGMTRLELANQLIEGQPAFHFAFIPREISD